MAVIRKSGQLSIKYLLTKQPLRNMCKVAPTPKGADTPWYEYWQPGPYPVTEEERRKAAEKYRLHPDEYEPYPPEEYFGDYPKLPKISADAKNPYYPWDFPEQRRNYHETLHEDFDMLTQDRYPYGVRQRLTKRQINMRVYLWLFGSFFLCLYVGDKEAPAIPKQFPRHGPHYTFEPAE